ncbi:hypothetical protein [Ottowia thiooxydans]|nr:hypothetical protein [Ottowia thiooxydans]
MAELLREQIRILQQGFMSMAAIELFEANCRFHETLAEWSRNRAIFS